MNKTMFIDMLIEYRFLDSIWKNVEKYIIENIVSDEDIIKLLSLYFVYISDGSSCMPIDIDILTREWNTKCESMQILLLSALDDEKSSEIEEGIRLIKECGLEAIKTIDLLKSNTMLVGDKKLFIIENDFLYARKYYEAKKGIKDSIKRLFNSFSDKSSIEFDIKKVWPSAADKQCDVIRKGINKNLIVTGGPGTGKTTAIFYLLLALLKNHSDYNIYMTAPSGKAASRIKESINGEIANARKNKIVGYDNEIAKLSETNEYTIHRLLELDFKTNGFVHNEKNQFNSKSIFIIDEASMIDVCIFDSLLKAIPNNARVFILGDKYQLPSVECGAVLSDLLACDSLKDNIVELEKSHRFIEGSEIYELAYKVNNGIIVEDIEFKPTSDFNIIKREKGFYPVFYYDDALEDNKEGFNTIIEKWAKHFYSNMQEECSSVSFSEEDLDKIYQRIDEARVLSAQNEGRIGVNTINKMIRDAVIDRNYQTKLSGFYPGIPLMILENNKALDLYNGDTGIIINFKDSDVLFFLIEKDNKNYKYDATTLEDKVLKLGKYMLYPLRMLDLKRVVYAYAITIHKSQGSGYENILVALPKKEGHPLLNRQILYTAITRTKGPTYIISNKDRVNEAIKNVLKRYTGIFK